MINAPAHSSKMHVQMVQCSSALLKEKSVDRTEPARIPTLEKGSEVDEIITGTILREMMFML